MNYKDDYFKNITFFTSGVFATLFWCGVAIFICLIVIGSIAQFGKEIYDICNSNVYELKENEKYIAEYIIDNDTYRINDNGILFRNKERLTYRSCKELTEIIMLSKDKVNEYSNISRTNGINNYTKKIDIKNYCFLEGIYNRKNGKDFLEIKNPFESNIICSIPKANINGFIKFLKHGVDFEEEKELKAENARKEEERINALYEDKKIIKRENNKKFRDEDYIYSSDTYEYYANQKIKEEEEEVSSNKVYDVVEEMPQFPGGSSALFEYINKNIKYPVVAEENGVQGRVVVTFVVECDGSITCTKVVKSVDPSLDNEAKRLVNSMPHWIPGKENGRPTRVNYTVPITFRLM